MTLLGLLSYVDRTVLAMRHFRRKAFLRATSAWALTAGLSIPVLGRFFDQQLYGFTFLLVACLPPVGTLLWRILAIPGRTRGL